MGFLDGLKQALTPKWEREMQCGKLRVVVITRFDNEFEYVVKKAEIYGYQLVNMTQSQNIIGWMETKRTLIFERTSRGLWRKNR